jgi:predicted RND superfamily exporter protein
MLRSKLFDFLTRLAIRRGTAVILVGVICTVCSLIFAGVYPKVEVKTNFADMMGPDAEISKQKIYMEENFPNATTVQVLIEGNNPARLAEVAREVESALEQEPKVREVYLEQPIDFFIDHGLLYIPTEDLQLITASAEKWKDTGSGLLRDPSVHGLFDTFEQVGTAQTRQNASMSFFTSQVFGRILWNEGPWDGPGMELGLSVDTQEMKDKLNREVIDTLKDTTLPSSEEEFLKTLVRTENTLDLVADVLDQGRALSPEDFADRVQELRELDMERLGTQTSRYNYSPDKTALVLEVSAVDNLGDMINAAPFTALVQGVIDEIGPKNPDVSVAVTGLPVMIAEEGIAIVDNFILVTILAFVGILSVFIIGFERIGLPALATIPLVMGVTWSFGIIAWTTGELTLFALMFPVLLFGIGIDFAIHLLSGYSSERSSGLEPEAALRAAFDKIGSGLLTGAVTTSAAFLVLMVSDFYGMRDMGFTAGIGILMALVAMVTVLPALIVQWDKRNASKGKLLPDVPFSGLERVAVHVRKHRYLVLVTFLVGTITFGYFGSKVTLDQNYLNIIPQDLPSLHAQDRILEKYETSNDFISVFADDLDEVERIRQAAARSNTFAQVIAPSELIPLDQESKTVHIQHLQEILLDMKPREATVAPHSYDAESIEQLREQWASIKGLALQGSIASNSLYGDDVRMELGRIRDIMNRIDARLNPASSDRLQYLDELLKQEVDKTYDTFLGMTENSSVQPEDIPPSILNRMRGIDGTWIVLIKANGDVWEPEFRAAFMDELRDTVPDGEFAGIVASWEFMLNLIISEIPMVLALTLGVVTIIVLVDLRSIRGALLSMVPLVVGLVWTIGITGMIGLPFNLISVMAIPLIVGIGIDDGVHIYHRIRKERILAPALAHSGKAVILTSLTTGIGFGSLMLSIHPGFYSLGLVTTIGIAACLVLSLFLLPALVAIFEEDLLKPDGEGVKPDGEGD